MVYEYFLTNKNKSMKGKEMKFTVKENLAADSFLIVSDTPFPVAIIENKFRPTSENKKNAELICDAFNVANKTGLTPSQLHLELEKAKELLNLANDCVKKWGHPRTQNV